MTFNVETSSFVWILNQNNQYDFRFFLLQKMTVARQLKSLNPLIIFTLGTMLVVLIRCLSFSIGSRRSEEKLSFGNDRIQKLEEEIEGGEKKAKMRKGKEEEAGKSIERSSDLIQDMSDPFEDFPLTQPFDCVNITQRFFNLFSNNVRIQSFFIMNSTSHPEAWTFVCVNNPEFNDIAREVFENKVEHMVIGLISALLQTSDCNYASFSSGLGDLVV